MRGMRTEAGVVPLAVTADPAKAVLALVPRGRHGAGQALIVTNFHVFSDPEDFLGGFMGAADSQKLLLNLAARAARASACAQQVTAEREELAAWGKRIVSTTAKGF